VKTDRAKPNRARTYWSDRAKNVPVAVGRVMRRLREQAGVAQEKLARTAGVDRRYLGTLERGGANVSIGIIHALLDSLDLTWRDFGAALNREIASRRRTRRAT
jgi:transcriptional regulator with XRE-family HTH domain